MIIQRGAAESRIVETGEAVGGGDIFAAPRIARKTIERSVSTNKAANASSDLLSNRGVR